MDSKKAIEIAAKMLALKVSQGPWVLNDEDMGDVLLTVLALAEECDESRASLAIAQDVLRKANEDVARYAQERDAAVVEVRFLEKAIDEALMMLGISPVNNAEKSE